MAKNANDKAAKLEADQATETPKAKRRALTPEERIAKLEAELKATREKAEAKANKAKAAAAEKRAKLVEKRDALNAQIQELTDIIGDHDGGTPADNVTELKLDVV